MTNVIQHSKTFTTLRKIFRQKKSAHTLQKTFKINHHKPSQNFATTFYDRKVQHVNLYMVSHT